MLPSRSWLIRCAAAAAILQAGASHAALVSHYTFDGTGNDLVGGRNLTLVNGAGIGAEGAPGVGGGQSLSLLGGTDYATYNVLAGDTLSGSYTVSAWLKPVSGTAGPQTFIATRQPTDNAFDAKFQNDRQIHGDIGNGAGAWITTAADASFDYRGNQWQHVAYSVGPTGYTIYANGQQVASGTYAANTPTLWDANNDLFIGAALLGGNAASENFNGLIDEVKVYNTALSAEDILADLAPEGGYVRINSLFNTGVDASGNVLGAPVDDPHYTLTGPSGALADATVIDDNFPIPPWLLADSNSAWIGLTNNDSTGAAGNYTYRTTFELGAGVNTNALIHGLWATDNEGVSIFLNGVDVTAGQVPVNIGSNGSFSHWTPFSISSGFVQGTNVLEFVLNNSGTTASPTGLRVALSGWAQTPEPASAGLLALAGAALMVRRRVSR